MPPKKATPAMKAAIAEKAKVAKAEEDAIVQKSTNAVTAAFRKNVRKFVPIIRPMLVGMMLTQGIEYISKLYNVKLDTMTRMTIMIVGYVFLNNLASRILPAWMIAEGPEEGFLENPIPRIDDLVLLAGEPVEVGGAPSAKKKVVTVVEFWATWCAPCRTMIPELSKLQKQYAHKDVYIASITFEEKLPVIQEFVLHLGPKIEYSLFWDSKQKAKTLLFDASKTKGIPFCMILNTENKIVWMGNPHDAKFREVLDKEAQNASDREPSTIKKAVQEKIMATEKATEKITEIPSAGDCEGDVCKVEKRVGRKVDEDN